MRERDENSELLKNISGTKRKARIMAITTILIFILILIEGIILIKNRVPGEAIVLVAIVYLIFGMFFSHKMKQIYEKEQREKLTIALVESCLSFQEFTQVEPYDIDTFKKEMISLADSYVELLPIEKPEEYKKYILDLLESIKFYAHVSKTKKDSIEIFVKYNKEGKLRYYKAIDKAIFLDEYSIQEEDEQEEK